MIDKEKLRELVTESKNTSDEIFDVITNDSYTDSTKFSLVGYKLSLLDEKLQAIEDIIEGEEK